ncbi:hypothetical protein ACSBR1_001639 [Camellia fascicularis]
MRNVRDTNTSSTSNLTHSQSLCGFPHQMGIDPTKTCDRTRYGHVSDTLGSKIENLKLQVPFFSEMDDQLLDAICELLVPTLFGEDDPVTEMLFIIRGRLESSTTNGGRPGTVRTLAEVKAFAFQVEDLKFVANQFRCLHSKKAAWQCYKRRRMARDLTSMESFALDERAVRETIQEEQQDGSNPSEPKPNMGVTILASRFAANTRRGIQKIKGMSLPQLQKPEEPDFSAELDE